MKILATVLFLTSLQNSYANEISPMALETMQSIQTVQLAQPTTDRHRGSRWQFLGCTHDDHDCHDLAHDSGYGKSRSIYDHHRCHHDDHQRACYGR